MFIFCIESRNIATAEIALIFMCLWLSPSGCQMPNFLLSIAPSTCSNFNYRYYKSQTESCQQNLALYMDRHLRSVAIMIEVTSRHMVCTHFNLDYSQMAAVAQQW